MTRRPPAPDLLTPVAAEEPHYVGHRDRLVRRLEILVGEEVVNSLTQLANLGRGRRVALQ